MTSAPCVMTSQPVDALRPYPVAIATLSPFLPHIVSAGVYMDFAFSRLLMLTAINTENKKTTRRAILALSGFSLSAGFANSCRRERRLTHQGFILHQNPFFNLNLL